MKTSRFPVATRLKPPAEILAELLGEGGLNQSEIARLTGIAQPTMSRILAGQKTGCSLASYTALLELYREHFTPANRARRARRARKALEERKALEDSIREQVRAELAAEAHPAPSDATVAETATD